MQQAKIQRRNTHADYNNRRYPTCIVCQQMTGYFPTKPITASLTLRHTIADETHYAPRESKFNACKNELCLRSDSQLIFIQQTSKA